VREQISHHKVVKISSWVKRPELVKSVYVVWRRKYYGK